MQTTLQYALRLSCDWLEALINMRVEWRYAPQQVCGALCAMTPGVHMMPGLYAGKWASLPLVCNKQIH